MPREWPQGLGRNTAKRETTQVDSCSCSEDRILFVISPVGACNRYKYHSRWRDLAHETASGGVEAVLLARESRASPCKRDAIARGRALFSHPSQDDDAPRISFPAVFSLSPTTLVGRGCDRNRGCSPDARYVCRPSQKTRKDTDEWNPHPSTGCLAGTRKDRLHEERGGAKGGLIPGIQWPQWESGVRYTVVPTYL